MHQVEELCDRIVLIDHGKVMLYGDLADIRRQFSGNAVLVRTSVELPQPGGVERIEPVNGTVKLHLAKGYGSAGHPAGAGGPETWPSNSSRSPCPTLDEIFIRVVQGQEAQRMSKIWHVALHEYRKHVFNRRFVFGLLSVPFVILLMVGLIFLIVSMEEQHDTDRLRGPFRPAHATLSRPPKPRRRTNRCRSIAFADEAEARSALEAGKIQAYYVLPADYLTSGELRVVHIGQVKAPARRQFYDFLGANLLKNTDPVIAARLVKGADVTIQSADGSRSLSSDNWFSFLIPIDRRDRFHHRHVHGRRLPDAGGGGGKGEPHHGGVDHLGLAEPVHGRQDHRRYLRGPDADPGLDALHRRSRSWSARNTIKFLQGIQISTQTLLVLVLTMLPSFVLVAALDGDHRRHGDRGTRRPADDRLDQPADLDPLHADRPVDEQPELAALARP